MKLFKKLSALILVIAMAATLVSCDFGTNENDEILDIGTLHVGYILTGNAEDDNQKAAYELFKNGYDEAGVEDKRVTLEQNVKPSDSTAIETAVADLTARGARLIFATDAGYAETLKKLAKDNPKVFFMCIGEVGATENDLDNFAVYDIRTYESAYLEGVIAGSSTKSGKIGFIADKLFGEVPITDVNAFTLGVQSVNAQATVSYAESDNVKASYESLVSSGCDVIYTRNFKADEENFFLETPASVSDNYVLVAVKDGKAEFISAETINSNVLYTRFITNTVNLKFADNENYSAGIIEGAVDVFPPSDPQIKAAADALKTKAYSGENLLGSKTAEELSDGYVTGLAEVK